MPAPAVDTNASTLPNATPDDVNKSKTSQRIVLDDNSTTSSDQDVMNPPEATDDVNTAPAPIDQD